MTTVFLMLFRIDSVKYLTNETVFNLTELPKKFGVIGAGFVGCELAQGCLHLIQHITILILNFVLNKFPIHH
jgi:pyruvate/2-oxoglutarate dehydrogenase complex dihydrolipoamide dehydrogenase (E3) component